VDTGLKKRNGETIYKQVAATLAIVDQNLKVVYSCAIRREYGSYRTTFWTRRVNGINDRDLQNKNCVPPETAIENVHKWLTGKLVIGLDVIPDFESLDLPMADYHVFDLQWHW
jgi:hypothetical protein